MYNIVGYNIWYRRLLKKALYNYHIKYIYSQSSKNVSIKLVTSLFWQISFSFSFSSLLYSKIAKSWEYSSFVSSFSESILSSSSNSIIFLIFLTGSSFSEKVLPLFLHFLDGVVFLLCFSFNTLPFWLLFYVFLQSISNSTLNLKYFCFNSSFDKLNK